jgi:hypothetical protein
MRQVPSQDICSFTPHASLSAEHNSCIISLHEEQDPDRMWTQDPTSWEMQRSSRGPLPYP